MLPSFSENYQCFDLCNPLSIASSEKRGIFPELLQELKNSEKLTVFSSSNTVLDPLIPFSIQNQNSDESANVTFDVTYTGFTPEAEAAFEQALKIWQQLIFSPISIEIEVYFDSLDGPGDVISASLTPVVRDFAGVPLTNTFYATSLAHHLSGIDVFPTLPDALIVFDSDDSWHFGSDSQIAEEELDLISVAVHELGHALGFGSFMEYDVDTGEGSYEYPAIYDRFVINGKGEKLTDFPNFSNELGTQLTSDNLFFQGPYTTYFGSGANPKLFAPSPWISGSSISHLERLTYTSGSAKSVMTPFSEVGEVNRIPSNIDLAILGDLGWTIPSLKVKNQIDSDLNGDQIEDVFFSNSSTGQNAYLIGPDYQNWTGLNPTPDWQPITIGDFSGDGFSDILFFNSHTSDTGYFDNVKHQWLMINQTPGWQPTVALDLTGDGTDDILYHNPSDGRNFYYDLVNGQWGILTQTPNWIPQAVGNIDLDSTPEIVFANEMGQNLIYNYFEPIKWQMLNDTPGWQPTGALDFNKDGIEEILYQNQMTGENFYFAPLTNQWSILNQTPGWISLA